MTLNQSSPEFCGSVQHQRVITLLALQVSRSGYDIEGSTARAQDTQSLFIQFIIHTKDSFSLSISMREILFWTVLVQIAFLCSCTSLDLKWNIAFGKWRRIWVPFYAGPISSSPSTIRQNGVYVTSVCLLIPWSIRVWNNLSTMIFDGMVSTKSRKMIKARRKVNLRRADQYLLRASRANCSPEQLRRSTLHASRGFIL